MLNVYHPAKSLEALGEFEFTELARFNQGAAGVFWASSSDFSPWEMHPKCDEILQILSGEITVEVLPKEGGVAESAQLVSGSMIVIPQGCWHRQKIISPMQQVYITPGPSLHSTDADPRLTETPDTN